MTPWKIVEHLASADPAEILGKLTKDNPFWIGASYAIDPFVGIILHLPIDYDPRKYGGGVDAKTFDKLVKSIIDGKLTGDNLSRAITALSHYCSAEEWLLWYKPILQGKMDIPLSLEVFNNFCPDDCRISPPTLSKPKVMTSMSDLPQQFFLQPHYPDEKVFWTIDSTHANIEVFCYDSHVKRIHDNVAEDVIMSFAQSRPMNIVLFGYITKRGFLADDILTKEQFTKESGAHPLYRRLMGLAKLEIPSVQMSPLLSSQKIDLFFQELGLILQQGYEGAVIRDLNARYPVHSDVLIKPSIKGTVTCKEVISDVGLRTEAARGKKVIETIVRLGLTAAIWKDISESPPIGRRLDVLSCGQKDTELLLPVFKQWRT